MSLHLDPRTKLVLVVVGFLGTILTRSLQAEMVFVLALLVPYFLSEERKAAVRHLIIYMGQVLISLYLLPHIHTRPLFYMVSFFTVGMRKFAPSLIAASYALRTTSVGEWVALLKKWRAPQSIIVVVAVAGRFMPTVKKDYYKIRQAMAFRGIGSRFRDYILHPVQTFEYILVPMLMNASQVSDDLTISALSKGLSREGPHSSLIQLRLSASDGLFIGAYLVFVFVYLIGGF